MCCAIILTLLVSAKLPETHHKGNRQQIAIIDIAGKLVMDKRVIGFGLIMVAVTIISQMVLTFGICMTTSNALALALVDYKSCTGTASSLFGFFYYCLISLCYAGYGIFS
jgi:hypothetical protein